MHCGKGHPPRALTAMHLLDRSGLYHCSLVAAGHYQARPCLRDPLILLAEMTAAISTSAGEAQHEGSHSAVQLLGIARQQQVPAVALQPCSCILSRAPARVGAQLHTAREGSAWLSVSLAQLQHLCGRQTRAAQLAADEPAVLHTAPARLRERCRVLLLSHGGCLQAALQAQPLDLWTSPVQQQLEGALGLSQL